MNWLVPLPVAVPLLAAACIVGSDRMLPRAAKDAIGVLASAATCGIGVALALESGRHDTVYWFGGWHPRGGLALGIAFHLDPLGAGMCALTGGIVCLALVYSLTFLNEAANLYDALMLVCCGAICGFALSADLFNLFVWLELAGVAAFALTGFEIRRIGPLQGAVNFAIVNTLGGYLVLIGIALLYARTGALNLAQIGRALGDTKPDGLVIVAFALVTGGFLCKAAVVPFHFWLADAYAVAPTPVCALFAGVMTDIGLLGVGRVYWTAFSDAGGGAGGLLIALGVASALLGGVMAFVQRNLKRMLAYSVVCHIGLMLAGIGLVSAKGLAGAAAMLLAHGLLTAGLFLVVGLVLAGLRSVDELRLRGRGRNRPWIAALWFAGAVGLAGPPFVGTFLGHSLIDDAATASGRGWLPPILWFAGALASAALIRAGLRIFLGLGAEADPLLAREPEERPPARGRGVRVTGAVTATLVVLGVAAGFAPGLGARIEVGADRFVDRPAVAASILDGRPAQLPPPAPVSVEHSSGTTFAYAVGAFLLAIGLALGGLRRRVRQPRPVVLLHAVHSGVIGDYVTWLTVGVVLIGGVWAVTLR